MPAPPPDLSLHAIARDTPYPAEAFAFVQRGLDFTVRQVHGELDEQTEAILAAGGNLPSRHISGTELCEGLRRFALREYGLMARDVLNRWQVFSTEDFGHIVFAMVEARIMHKTDDDRIEDFQNLFDFDSAFRDDLEIAET